MRLFIDRQHEGSCNLLTEDTSLPLWGLVSTTCNKMYPTASKAYLGLMLLSRDQQVLAGTNAFEDPPLPAPSLD